MIKAMMAFLFPAPIVNRKAFCKKHGLIDQVVRFGGTDERYCALCFKEKLGEPVQMVEEKMEKAHG